jgi:hypothetical protein
MYLASVVFACRVHDTRAYGSNAEFGFSLIFYRSEKACALPKIRSKHEQYRFAFCSIDV